MVAALMVLLVGPACGGNSPNEAASRASAPAQQDDSKQAAFTEADLDKFERGLRKEIEAVQGKIDGPLSIDLQRADAETKARVSGDAFADLPPDASLALRARMDRLVPLWSEYKTLVAVAG